MALERKDNIGDTTTSTGTGTINLAAVAQAGARIFAGNVTSGSTVRYDIRSADNTEWEIGEGVFTDGSPDTLTRVTVYASSNAGSLVNFSAGTKNVSMVITAKDVIGEVAPPNLLKNGNFINNSTNGFGGTPDDWTSSNANPVQGGIPALTKQNLIDGLGVADGDIEGLWPLNEASGNALDLSSNGYNLTDTNTVGVSSDGLMASARDFELDNSEYFQIANASSPNLNINTSFTFISYIKPESLAESVFIGKRQTGNEKTIKIFSTSQSPCIFQSGLTPNLLTSDVKLETGKWYMIVGIYSSSENKLKIWANGIKKEVAVTGSPSASPTSEFTIGRLGDFSGQYFDGLMQNACVLSVALTDNQVRKLFAMTMYKGQKIRRATTNAYLYEELTQPQVEQLRGETITFAADAYCSSTNHGIYITTDGTGGTTTKAHPAGANTWERIGLSITVPSDATYIRYGLLAETTDGNSWFRECSGYIGSSVLPYAHSADDWSRFPRLLKMDMPSIVNGYTFEEGKWFTWTPTYTGFSSMSTVQRFMFTAKKCLASVIGAGTSNATGFDFTLPIIAKGNSAGSTNIGVHTIDNGSGLDTGILGLAVGGYDSFTAKVGKTFSTRAANAYGGFTSSGLKGVEATFEYEID